MVSRGSKGHQPPSLCSMVCCSESTHRTHTHKPMHEQPVLIINAPTALPSTEKKKKKKKPACCAYSSLIVQQHSDYNVDADTCIIPTETCKQAHMLPTALVHAGGLADAVLHVSGPQHTQHTRATACTHTHTHLQSCNSSSQAGTTCPQLTAFICTDTYCLHAACYTHRDLSVSSKQPHLALSHMQWTCERTVQVSVHSHFLCASASTQFYHGHPKQLAISMQLLEYIQATIAFHPYGSGPQMVCLAPKLVVLFLWSAIFLNKVNTLTCEATLTLPTNCAWVYVQKHMHKTHMQIPQNVLCRLCTRLYA